MKIDLKEHSPETVGETPTSIPGDRTLRCETCEDSRLKVVGDIDLYQASAFRTAGEAHITQTNSPRIDLREVLFMDSAGLATLLHLTRMAKAQGKILHVLASGSPRRVLQIMGIDKALVLEE